VPLMPMVLWTWGLPGLTIPRGSTAASASSHSYTFRRPSSAVRGGERWRERRRSVAAVRHGAIGVYGALPASHDPVSWAKECGI